MTVSTRTLARTGAALAIGMLAAASALAADLKVKKIDMDSETRRTTIKRLKVQQFETRKNDEYQAFNHEITRYDPIRAVLNFFEQTVVYRWHKTGGRGGTKTVIAPLFVTGCRFVTVCRL